MNGVFAGFILGLFGSLHCVGMCGPLVLALPLSRLDRFFIISKSIVYNLGRVLSYSFMGLLMGSLGWCLELGGLQQLFSVVLGILLLYSAITQHFPQLRMPLNLVPKGIGKRVVARIKKSMTIDSNFSAVKLGILNGFLPCGLVYIALATSVTLGDPERSTLYMFLFGLGTMPLMILVMAVGNLYKNIAARIRKYLPLMIAVLGIYLIVRGLGVTLPEVPF